MCVSVCLCVCVSACVSIHNLSLSCLQLGGLSRAYIIFFPGGCVCWGVGRLYNYLPTLDRPLPCLALPLLRFRRELERECLERRSGSSSSSSASNSSSG